MYPLFSEYVDHFAELHSAILRAVEGLQPDALDWSPGPEMNSIAVLAAHVAGSELYWVGEVVGRIPAQRDREAEFRSHGLDAAELGRRLDAALERVRKVMGALRIEDAGEPRFSPRHDRNVTVAWALLHSLTHTAEHVGHIGLTRQLWEQRHG